MANDTTSNSDVERTTNVTTDRETIRTWIEESGSKPAYLTTGEGERELYVHHSEHESTGDVEEVSWDEFLDRIESDELALVRHGDRPGEGPEQFELVDRTEAIERAALEDREVEEALMEGETVETEITETRVVERTVRETETIESKVVDSETVRDEVIDTKLVRREIANIHLGERETGVAIVEDYESTGWEEEVEEIDVTDREVITVDVDETREVTREIIERKTVESRVVDHDVEETETLESDTLEGRVDLEGVQRTILTSDLLGGEIETEEAIEGGHVESEFTDEGVIETHLYERRIVEDEVVDRKRLTFELVDEELIESETVDSVIVESYLVGSDAVSEDAEVEGIAIEREETVATEGVTTGAEAETTATAGETAVMLDDDDVGKDVIDDNGEKVGVVTEVDEATNVMYVDPHPGLAQRVKTRLGWEGHDEDAYTVETDRIAEITDDEVLLRDF